MTRFLVAKETSMQEPNNSSLFEAKSLIVLALVGVGWFFWQKHLNDKYPNAYKKPAATATNPATPEATSGGTAATTAPEVAHSPETKAAMVPVEEKQFQFQDENISFTVTSHGMGLKNVILNKYVDYDKNPIKLGQSETNSLFELKMTATQQPVDFDLKEEGQGQFVGVAQVGGSTLTRTLKYDHDKQSFTNKIVVSNPDSKILQGLDLAIPEKITVAPAKSFFMPNYQHQDFYVKHSGKADTVNFSSAKENVAKTFPGVSLISAGSQYFSAAILDHSDIIPEAVLTSSVQNKTAMANLVYKPSQARGEFALEQVLYAGPKSIEVLKNIDPELVGVIDHGFFAFIARPLLYIMKAFYSVIGNWGFAIICLTLLVRACVMPFNLMSFRSMKGMQKIQPALAELRVRYKDDPVSLNREMYALMKQHKANPMGGCLPMFIQVPVFFALYRVIGSSIELYHSPFIGWITDLSSPDRFFVLPVIMGVAMFLQQKITPSTMDPAQAKVMAFLPLIFSVFMLQLPSGLTLYMCVSTLFGISQQYIFLRERKKATS